MTWYLAGAAVFAVLFILNAVFVRSLRSRGAVAAPPAAPHLKRTLSGGQAIIATLPAATAAVCWAARDFAPESWLGQAMTPPGAILGTFLYACAIVGGLSVAARFLRRGHQRR